MTAIQAAKSYAGQIAKAYGIQLAEITVWNKAECQKAGWDPTADAMVVYEGGDLAGDQTLGRNAFSGDMRQSLPPSL